MAVNRAHVISAGLLLVAGGIALVATKRVGNVRLTRFTEDRPGPLQEHIVSVDELNMSRTFSAPIYPMHYPGQVAAGINMAIADGFSMLWQPADPQIAALPAERGDF